MSLLKFPCKYPLKIIGSSTSKKDFTNLIKPILQNHIAELNNSNIKIRKSSGGKYFALTVVFTAQSKNQLDALYRELSSHPEVIMTL
jgi:uncharacterized protein